jgi:hypothetical protein
VILLSVVILSNRSAPEKKSSGTAQKSFLLYYHQYLKPKIEFYFPSLLCPFSKFGEENTVISRQVFLFEKQGKQSEKFT